MSESTLEIVEISDISINPETSPELKQVSAALQITTKTKRQLSESDVDVRSPKKICTETEDMVSTGVDVNCVKILLPFINTISTLQETQFLIDDTVVDESKVAAEESEFIEPDILDTNIEAVHNEVVLEESFEEDLVEEVHNKSLTLSEEQYVSNLEEEEEEEAEEGLHFGPTFVQSVIILTFLEEQENSSDEDDEAMMERALNASGKHAPPKGPLPIDSDEPIALDDSDDASDEYSVDNRVIGESDEEDPDNEEESLFEKRPVKSHLILMRKLIKKSLNIMRTRHAPAVKEPGSSKTQPIEHRPVEEEIELDKKVPVPAENPKAEVKLAEPETVPATIEEKPVEKVEVKELTEVQSAQELIITEVPKAVTPEVQRDELLVKCTEPANGTAHDNEEVKTLPSQPENGDDAEPMDQDNEKPSCHDSNDSSRHETSLLTEISNSSIEEVFNRYVLKATNQSPTLDEFSEELFYCLQMNNQEIEKAKILWNEKLHIKYKIRELMETIRRHRAVVEIETFGFKPESSGNNVRPIISSKSSTTTNSENDDKHFRMSTESVNRLIQDVRATMLKRDDKLRVDESSNAGDSLLAAHWNSLQANNVQGRQGPIVDVQSIINDFRSKNPQEIPRRGRRMKGSYGNAYYDNQQQNDDSRSSRNEFLPNVTNNASEFNSSTKTNSSGYPEVSLLPVHNLYKNLANSGASGSGAGHFSGGQKSSLLQSILTKVSTKIRISKLDSFTYFLATNEESNGIQPQSRNANDINVSSSTDCTRTVFPGITKALKPATAETLVYQSP